MSHTINGMTAKRYHYGSHHEVRRHLLPFVDAYGNGRRLKILRGLTPHELAPANLDRAACSVQARSPTLHPGTEHVRAFSVRSRARPGCR
jgi:hypothetical protein